MYWCYKLLQSEHYRNCKFNANRFTTLHTWFPLRHRVDHTESFFIQIRVYTTYNFCIYDTTVSVHNELYDNTTLSTISCAIVGYLMFLARYCINAACPPGKSGMFSTTSKIVCSSGSSSTTCTGTYFTSTFGVLSSLRW